jgi:DNA primase
MSGRIPREFIDDLLVRVDIVDLIDSHVPLKKTGANYVARCPFHDEKSPSFSVSRKKQFYHCFGCGEGGDAISFLEKYSNLDFVEAVEDLASFLGIEVPREASEYQEKKQDYTALYSILEQVAVFYVEQLRSHPQSIKAIEYLKSRGVSGAVAKDFSLGFAPDEWGALTSRFDKKLLLDAGMVSSNDRGGSYDRFRGRLMFPIRDKRKRIVGFGGRVLDDSMPKYLNSPETAVFSKGREIYGLYEMLEKNNKPQRILIVEGYMDVIALAQFGIDYSVATLGTATSKMHLDLLFRFSSELVFCFDGDAAGRKAAWRAMELVFPCLNGRRQVKFMLLPQGHDPDSLVREKGGDGFAALVEGAQSLSEYFLEHLSGSLNLESIDGKARLLEDAKGYLKSMPGGYAQDEMLKAVGDKVELVRLEISKNQATRTSLKQTPLKVLVALLLQNPEFSEIIEEEEVNWNVLSFHGNESVGVELLQDILQTIENKQPKNAPVLRSVYQETRWKKSVNMLANLSIRPVDNIPFDEEAEFRATLKNVVQQGRKQYFDDEIQKKIRKGK